MNLIDTYILEYTESFVFNFVQYLSERIFDIEIDIDIFEYKDQCNYREKAHATFKKGDLIYQCDFCDRHDYENDFYPIVFDGQRFICFRKTLYGFTFINADTLSVQYEYFPESVIHGEESFIITDVKQLDDLLIFEGCYWACPYECFAFDYKTKLFLNVSKMCGMFSLDKTVLKDDELIICGTDENDYKKQIVVSKQDITVGINKYGKKDF